MSDNYVIVNGELYHWGVKGMRWGVRRWQNPDGTLTEAGKKRYNRQATRDAENLADAASNKYYSKIQRVNKSIDSGEITVGSKKYNSLARDIEKGHSAVNKAIDRLSKKYDKVSVDYAVDADGYTIKWVNAYIEKYDKLGRSTNVINVRKPVK